jgi:hypothetical protein
MIFSTSDVFLGLCAGLNMIADIEVIPFRWERPLKVFGTLISAAIEVGKIPPTEAEKMRSFTSWIAAADAIGLAVDQEVDAVIVVNGILFPPSRALVLRKLGIPVACFGTEAPYFLKTEQDIAPCYTHWFTNEKNCVGMFGDVPQFYLRHAYNPAVHARQEVDVEVFVTVEQFDVDQQGRGVLLAWWRLLSPGHEKELKAGQFHAVHSGPAPESDPQGAAATMSELAADLSREIAQAVKAAAPNAFP